MRLSLAVRGRQLVAAGLALVAVLVVPAVAAGPDDSSESREEAAATSREDERNDASRPGEGGMRVFIDPETGRFTSRPTPEQLDGLGMTLEAPDPAFRRSVEGLRPFPLSRGGLGLFLAGRFQTAVTVRVKEDGSYETLCVTPENPSREASSSEGRGAQAPPER